MQAGTFKARSSDAEGGGKKNKNSLYVREASRKNVIAHPGLGASMKTDDPSAPPVSLFGIMLERCVCRIGYKIDLRE